MWTDARAMHEARTGDRAAARHASALEYIESRLEGYSETEANRDLTQPKQEG